MAKAVNVLDIQETPGRIAIHVIRRMAKTSRVEHSLTFDKQARVWSVSIGPGRHHQMTSDGIARLIRKFAPIKHYVERKLFCASCDAVTVKRVRETCEQCNRAGCGNDLEDLKQEIYSNLYDLYKRVDYAEFKRIVANTVDEVNQSIGQERAEAHHP